jgi:signal transduction histidine kinase
MKESFRFSPDVLARLGEELIPNPDQGIIELVKNSYDADATQCTVQLIDTNDPGGTIVISDNGVGMTQAAIVNGWLVIGSSSKRARKPTKKYGRLPVGDKGLGRLAGLRQGTEVTLRTRPEEKPGVEYSLCIPWLEYDRVAVVEEVLLPVQQHATRRPPGTDIEIRNLRQRYTRRDVQRLARELVLLADPFNNKTGFRPSLVASEFSDLEDLVKNSYFGDAEYHLKATLETDGTAKAVLLDWNDNVIARAKQKELSDTLYECPPAGFELWAFLLDSKTFSTRRNSLGEVREWLKVVGGVHLYHRELRVRPYGDQGHDWLEMNLARAKSPEERPSTNTAVGRITVDDPDDLLVQKTDRIGFIENDPFQELRRFAIDALDWMADIRLREAEKRRLRTRKETPHRVDAARTTLDAALQNLPQASREVIENSVRRFEKEVDRNVKALQVDLQLYRSLATAGTTAAVFAHETGKPITLIEKVAETLRTRGKRLAPDRYDAMLKPPIEKLFWIAGALKGFARLPMFLLQRDKRRAGVLQVTQTIDNLLAVFQPFFADADIKVDRQRLASTAHVRGSVALLEAVLTNLLTNSIDAFNTEGARNKGRSIRVRDEISGDRVLITVADNGSGIDGLTVSEIWVPGRTTKPGGTGFGLTIVRDSVEDLGGHVRVRSRGELGGAEFTIELPRTDG